MTSKDYLGEFLLMRMFCFSKEWRSRTLWF
jgi:hypothetical protein